ncbi:MAG: hypothetical protein ACRECQ_19035 [Burkholderiaceae bacterium]
MNKKFFIAWLVIFIAWMAGDFLIHGTLLGPDYMRQAQLYRTEADSQAYFAWMLLAHVLMAGAFTWIYARGKEARPWLGQGARYGLAVALLSWVPTYLIYYAVQPLPGTMVVKQVIFSTILIVVLGVIVAWLYRERGTT